MRRLSRFENFALLGSLLVLTVCAMFQPARERVTLISYADVSHPISNTLQDAIVGMVQESRGRIRATAAAAGKPVAVVGVAFYNRECVETARRILGAEVDRMAATGTLDFELAAADQMQLAMRLGKRWPHLREAVEGIHDGQAVVVFALFRVSVFKLGGGSK